MSKRKRGYEKGKIDKGAVYVVCFLILCLFGSYIMIGGNIPTTVPGDNFNFVNVPNISPQPTIKDSLQLYTFEGITGTPMPTKPVQTTIAPTSTGTVPLMPK